MSDQDDFDGGMLDRKLDFAIAAENDRTAARDMVVEVLFDDKSRHNFTLKATDDGNYEGFVFRMKFRYEWVEEDDDSGYWEAYPLMPVGSGETDVRDHVCWGRGDDLIEVVRDVCRTRGLVAPKNPTGDDMPNWKKVPFEFKRYNPNGKLMDPDPLGGWVSATEVHGKLIRLYEAIDQAIERCVGFGTATGKVTDIHKILKAARD